MATQPSRIPIDKAGRIVLPKEIRDRLGIAPGTEFEVTEERDRIVLNPMEKGPKIINKGGWLVVVADEPPKEDIVEFTRKTREERNRHVGGY